MGWKEHIIAKFYAHKYGIMGTVIFHLLLAIVLVSVGIAGIHTPEVMEIELAAPPEEVLKKIVEEKERKAEILKKTSQEEVEKMLRAIAVNENASSSERSRDKVQKYIDEVTEELEREKNYGGRYQPRKDKNYDRDSLQNENDRKEQLLDSLKSTFYSGESSVSYNLKDRYARFLPIPVFKCEFGGKVVVAIVVNRKGVVQKAEVIKEQSEPDDCLQEVATGAAKRSKFNEKPAAPDLQTGTITYNFVKQ